MAFKMAVKPNYLLMDQIESTVQKLPYIILLYNIYSVILGAKYKLSNLYVSQFQS